MIQFLVVHVDRHGFHNDVTFEVGTARKSVTIEGLIGEFHEGDAFELSSATLDTLEDGTHRVLGNDLGNGPTDVYDERFRRPVSLEALRPAPGDAETHPNVVNRPISQDALTPAPIVDKTYPPVVNRTVQPHAAGMVPENAISRDAPVNLNLEGRDGREGREGRAPYVKVGDAASPDSSEGDYSVEDDDYPEETIPVTAPVVAAPPAAPTVSQPAPKLRPRPRQ